MLRRYERVTIELLANLPVDDCHGLTRGERFPALRLVNCRRDFPKWIALSKAGGRVRVLAHEAIEVGNV